MKIEGKDYSKYAEKGKLSFRNNCVYLDDAFLEVIDPNKVILVVSPHPVTIESCGANLVVGNNAVIKEAIVTGDLKVENLTCTNFDLVVGAAAHIENLCAEKATIKGTTHVEKMICDKVNADKINVGD